ncbi:3050_t:CDS:2 [Funneliformis geosporum]|uniref:3-hydroxyacyl-CoA dehydrogenase n=1 Tax=Funneliformis geosporum TaxID=1117311 RepID=A0A9W4WLQ7_9GLOM|nr:3050_t:CDS:2 [Funneliformis geosporum]CAI2170886.1 6834_t:CDS:2 [Funneliformis geosporum]
MSKFVISTFRGRLTNNVTKTTFKTNLIRPLLLSHNFSSTSNNYAVQNISVYGSGLMGAGIVQVAAQYGFKVTMVDLNQEFIDRGKEIINASLKRVAKKQHKDDKAAQNALIEYTWSNIETDIDSVRGAEKADLIVEAIVENLQTKQNLFQQLDKVAKPNAIFASNTSSLPISEIAKATQRQDKFAGLHFFNPVPQMKLVEIIKTSQTSKETYKILNDVIMKMEKAPVICKDTPGFIVNRLLVPYLMESIRLVERGEASMKDVDTAMKLGAGMPMGPFELCDFVGLDTLKSIVDGWRKDGKIDANLVATSKILDDLVESGHLGRKSGKGFHKYV